MNANKEVFTKQEMRGIKIIIIFPIMLSLQLISLVVDMAGGGTLIGSVMYQIVFSLNGLINSGTYGFLGFVYSAKVEKQSIDWPQESMKDTYCHSQQQQSNIVQHLLQENHQTLNKTYGYSSIYHY